MPATKRPIRTCFRYAFVWNRLKLATGNNSQTHYTKGRRSLYKRAPTDLLAVGFSYYFTPLTGVLFTFPSRYLFTIGHQGVFSLTQWSGQIPTKSHVLHGTWVTINYALLFIRLQDFHLLRSCIPAQFILKSCLTIQNHLYANCPRFPHTATRGRLTQHEFLAVPISLTTTTGITFVFFSWRYLDVSVHAVALSTLYIQIEMLEVRSSGFPHSEILGSMLG